MGGPERLRKQAAKGRLDARARIARLADSSTSGDNFIEYGALAGGADPSGAVAMAADGLVGGLVKINGEATVVLSEDFTVQGGSIGHVNAAKRLRLVRLALEEGLPLVVMLDGAGERASNSLTRYPYAPTDLQVLADLKGKVPMVTLVLGTSAGHGALSGLFSDFVVMSAGSSMFAAGPPLVKASLGLEVSPGELGGASLHVEQSGVAHNLAPTEDDAFDLARRYLALLSAKRNPQASGSESKIEAILDVVPSDLSRPYDARDLVSLVVDEDSLLEVQPSYGRSMVTAFATIGGCTVLVVANQPLVSAGAITVDAARKATHFLRVAADFALPVVFLADNPGVMPGPEAERAGTLRAAAEMYLAARALSGPKIHVTVRKAFGFGSSLMAMNPFDRQTVTLAFPGIALGGVPAGGGADAEKVSDDERARLAAVQSGAWTAADNGSYDRVIDPRDLRLELLRVLAIGGSTG